MGRDQVVESDTGNDSSRGKDQGHSSLQGLGDGIGTSERLLNGNHLENRASCATRMGGGGLWDRVPMPRGVGTFWGARPTQLIVSPSQSTYPMALCQSTTLVSVNNSCQAVVPLKSDSNSRAQAKVKTAYQISCETYVSLILSKKVILSAFQQ